MTELVGSVILAKLDWLAQSVKVQGNAAELGDDLTPAAFADAAASICNRVVGYRPRHGARSVSAEATCDLFDFLAGSDMLARLRNLSRFSPEPACAATETRAGEFWNLAALIQNVFEHATDYNPSVEYTVLALTEFQARTVYDLGSGAGHLALALARRGTSVTCTERNGVARQFLRYRRSKHCLETVVNLHPVRKQYDAIAAIHVLDHLANPAAVIACLARRLRRGGLLLTATSFIDDGWHTADPATLRNVSRPIEHGFRLSRARSRRPGIAADGEAVTRQAEVVVTVGLAIPPDDFVITAGNSGS